MVEVEEEHLVKGVQHHMKDNNVGKEAEKHLLTRGEVEHPVKEVGVVKKTEESKHFVMVGKVKGLEEVD